MCEKYLNCSFLLNMGLAFAAGLAYVLLSIPFILLQLLTLAVFASQSEYRQLTCYRIMFSIGLADTAQLVVHAVSGMAIMCDHVFGAVLFAAWMVIIPQHTMLAANRLMIVSEGALTVEHVTSTRERRVANVVLVCIRDGVYSCSCEVQTLLGACWLLGLLCFIACMTPSLASIRYAPETRLFDFGQSGSLVAALDFFDDDLSIAFPLLTLAIYIWIILLLIRRVGRLSFFTLRPLIDMSGQIWLSVTGHGTALITASELRVLVQSMVVFSVFAAMFLCWHLHDSFTEGMPAVTTLLRIAKCGVGPVLYLSMNTRTRKVVMGVWDKIGKMGSNTLVTVAPSA